RGGGRGVPAERVDQLRLGGDRDRNVGGGCFGRLPPVFPPSTQLASGLSCLVGRAESARPDGRDASRRPAPQPRAVPPRSRVTAWGLEDWARPTRGTTLM